jgi:hypothetical protein
MRLSILVEEVNMTCFPEVLSACGSPPPHVLRLWY